MEFKNKANKFKKPPPMSKYFQKLGHHCVLKNENNYIDDLKKKYSSRLYFDIFLASPTNPRTQNVLWTTATIKQEIDNQLKFYPLMIHPLSDFRFYWESFLILVYLVAFTVVPTQFFAHLLKHPICYKKEVNYVRSAVNFLWVTEMIFSFSTGYIQREPDKSQVIMNRKEVALSYIKTYFIFDIIGSTPYFLSSCNENSTREFILSIGTLFKIARFGRLLKYTRRFLQYFGVNYYVINIFLFILKFLIIIHWCSALEIAPGLIQNMLSGRNEKQWYEEGDLASMGFTYQYAICVYRAISSLTSTGYSLYHTDKTISDMIYNIFLIIFGRILYCIMFAQILALMQGLRYSTGKYEEMVNQLTKYMKHKNLTESTKINIRSYYAYRYQYAFFKEQKILNTIPVQLKEDIIMHSSRRFLENVSFFANLPQLILTKLVACLKSQTFLTNEIIIRAGAYGDCMYFITAGTVAVYTVTGKEICHLEDGDHFGEISLVSSHKMRTATVIAVEISEIYRLDLVDFNNIVTPYPDLMHNVQRIATARLESLLLFEEQSNRNNYKSIFMRGP